MRHDQRAEKFRQIVENKFQIYNSLFMSLPYDKMTNIGMLLPFLYEESKAGYQAGKTPEEIVEDFLPTIQIYRPRTRNLNCCSKLFSILKDRWFYLIALRMLLSPTYILKATAERLPIFLNGHFKIINWKR